MAITAERVPRTVQAPLEVQTHTHALLYQWGAIAAALAAVLTPVAVGAFALSPPPGYDEGAAVWFDHINDNVLLGWMSLDLPLLIISLLMIPSWWRWWLRFATFGPPTLR